MVAGGMGFLEDGNFVRIENATLKPNRYCANSATKYQILFNYSLLHCYSDTSFLLMVDVIYFN